MVASNGHNSETITSIATKRGIETGSVSFSDVIQLKSLSTKREAGKGTPGSDAIFTPKIVETLPLTCMFGQKYQQVEKR